MNYLSSIHSRPNFMLLLPTTMNFKSIIQLLRLPAATLVLYGLYRVAKLIYGEFTSPIRDLPGPKNTNFIIGNFKDVLKEVSCIRCACTSMTNLYRREWRTGLHSTGG